MARFVLAASILLTTAAEQNSVPPSAHEFSASINGYRSSHKWLPRHPVITSPTAEELVEEAALPTDFDWRNVGGRSFVTPDLNQHLPHYCGACWLHGGVHSLNDRIKIQRGGRYPDVMLSRQALLNCVPDASGEGPPPGCNGGDVFMIHKYMHENKVPDESCMPYLAANAKCEPFNVCRNCAPILIFGPNESLTVKKGPCYAVPNYAGYGVKEYGNISGEIAMMKEIYARGPIACAAAVVGDKVQFLRNYTTNEGILKDDVWTTDTVEKPSAIDHEMEVAGWGVTPLGTKYWVVRNSWGTYWGDMGWVKIRRGINQQMIEYECDWAVVDVDDVENELKGQVLGDYYTGTKVVPRSAAMGERFKSDQETIASSNAAIPNSQVSMTASTELAIPVSVALVTGAAFGSIITKMRTTRSSEPHTTELLG